MNAVVVYYSRTGNTRKAGRAIANRLECNEAEIAEREARTGMGGYFHAGIDAMRRRSTAIEELDADFEGADLVVVGTPVWAFTVAPPVRAFLEQHAGEIGRIAFFCTMGGSGDRRAFRAMEDLAGKAPEAVLALTERDVKGNLEARIDPFVAALSDG